LIFKKGQLIIFQHFRNVKTCLGLYRTDTDIAYVDHPSELCRKSPQIKK